LSFYIKLHGFLDPRILVAMNGYLAAGGAVPPFFILLTLVLSSVVVVSLILTKFKQSLLVGYFLCGLLLANSGVLDWAGVGSEGVISALSEIGIVLLLFTLGIEFSLSELKALKRPALVGGGLQVGLTIASTMVVAMLFGAPWNHALILGFAVSLSSTAVSLKSFQDLGLPESPQARVTLGIAIFQDLAAILFMVLMPAIASVGVESLGADAEQAPGLGSALLKGALFTLSIIILSRHGFPQMLDAVARTRSRELFTVTVVGLCAAVALVSGLLGLSPALGAFAAGVVVSESIYSHRVLSDVLPFKDLFLTVFFVSVGLLIDTTVLIENWASITGITLLILILKGAITAIAARASGLRLGSWITTAAALCSTGEFSIVLLNRANDFKIFNAQWEQVLLASTAISMGLIPTLMKWSLGAVDKLKGRKSASICRWEEEVGMVHQIEELQDHIIICGYGPVGRNLHRNLKMAHVPVVVLEMNAETVKTLISQGIMALFADARDLEALEAAQFKKARGIAITFPDKEVAVATTHMVRDHNPGIIVYARSKFSADTQELYEAGVTHVMHDEEQSGRAMIRSVMQCYSANLDEDWADELNEPAGAQ